MKKKKKNKKEEELKKEYYRGFKEGEKDTIDSIVHETRREILIVQDRFDEILTFLGDKNLLDEKLSNITDSYEENETSITIFDIVEKIKDKLDRIEEIISQNQKEVHMTIDHDFKRINFSKFVEDYINKKKNEYSNIFKVKMEIIPDFYIEVNEASMKTLFDNFLDNCSKHAFSEYNEKNEVLVKLFYDYEQLEGNLELSNNGRKFNLTADEFVAKNKKGKSSDGQGFGGYRINQILNQQNNQFLYVDLYIDEKYNGFRMIIKLMQLVGEGTEG